MVMHKIYQKNTKKVLQYWEIYRLNGLDGLILHLKYRNKQTWDGGCAAERMQLFRILNKSRIPSRS